MKIKQYFVGDVDTNCYLVYDETSLEGAFIDPGDNADRLLRDIRDLHIDLKYILLTHGHFDHIMAVNALKKETGAPVVINKKDEYLFEKDAALAPFGEYGRQLRSRFDFPGADIWAEEGTEVTFGGMTAKYLHTPGHTPGSCVIMLDNSVLFTGDTLFRGSCGRTDLPGGDWDEIAVSLKRIYELPGDYRILPGHEGATTLERERVSNPFFRQVAKK